METNISETTGAGKQYVPFFSWSFVTFRRFLRWLFGRRMLGRMAFVLACLATLIALYYGVTNWRGGRALQQHQQAMMACGEWVEFKSLIPPPVPDADNLAMTPFLAPLFDFVPGTQQPRDTNAVNRTSQFLDSVPSLRGSPSGWRLAKYRNLPAWQKALEAPAEQRREARDEPGFVPERSAVAQPQVAATVLAKLKHCDAVLAELKAAAARPKARFNLHYNSEMLYDMLLRHLSVLRGVDQILALRASALLATARPEEALDDILLGLDLADSIRDEPVFISYLVRQQMVDIALQPVWEGLAEHRWSESQLIRLQERLQRIDLLTSARRALAAERAGGNQVIRWLREGPNRKEMADLLGMEDGWETFARLVLPTGWYARNQVAYDRYYHESLFPVIDLTNRVVRVAFAEEQSRSFDERTKWRPLILADDCVLLRLLGNLDGFSKKFALGQCNVDQAVIACSLERARLVNGRFPGSLGELTPRWLTRVPNDVTTGKAMPYRPTPDGGFVLYSVGWNQRDDGGQTVQSRDKKSTFRLEDGDWVWTCPDGGAAAR